MRRSTTLDEAQMQSVVDAARQWSDFESVAGSIPLRHQNLWSGARAPTLHLEDVSGIPFVADIPGVEQYQHRARVRAKTGDVFAAVTPVSKGYEPYCREFLGLGAPQLVIADPVDGPMAVTLACQHGATVDKLAAWASLHSRILLHPYMAIAEVWELAEILGTRSGTAIEVVGPTPEAVWVANDKASLMELTELVLGESHFPETHACTSVDEVAATLIEFAGRFDSVGIKRTRCASAMGNLVYDADDIVRQSHEEVAEGVADFLEKTEWRGDEEVLVVEWVRTDTSPSTQLWIPPLGHGSPIVEGVYEQLLEGEEKVFLGSRPSTLNEAINESISEASLAIAAVFQALGYAGRCSFDFIVGGDLEGEFRPLLTECNGRWGGTSTPMFLMDRLYEDQRPHYVAQDYVHPGLEGASFEDLHAILEDDLFNPRTRQGRFVLYNVGPLANDGKFDVISIGRTPDEAMEGVAEILPRRLRI